MRAIKMVLRNDNVIDFDEQSKLSPEQEAEIVSLLRKYGAIKPNEECSLVETTVRYTVHQRGN